MTLKIINHDNMMKITRIKKDHQETLPTKEVFIEHSPWKILLVDDEPDIHTITRLNLKHYTFQERPLHFLEALSATDAQTILQTESDIAVAFIDLIMETEDAGLKLIDFIRCELKNTAIRLIVRTGQMSNDVNQIILSHHDISEFKDKTALTKENLWTTMNVALHSFQQLTHLEK